MSAHCTDRRQPQGETTGSWIRPHICRWPAQHDGHPHECTCGYAWDDTTTPTASPGLGIPSASAAQDPPAAPTATMNT